MLRSIATVSLSGSLLEKLSAAAAAGFDGVELFETDLISCPLRPAGIKQVADDLGLSIDLYQPFRDFEAVPAELLKRNLKRAEQKFAVMTQLGAPMMLACSNARTDALNDDALATEQLHLLAERAAGHGLRIAYEALAWGTHVNDYLHAWDLVRTADHPNLGICLDSFHILTKITDPGRIRDLPGEKIFFLQLADAPGFALDTLHFSRHYRCFPGQGVFDLTAFTGHVLATGYRGPLSLEVFNDVFRQADADRTAVDAMRSLIILGDAVRQQLPEASSSAEPSSSPGQSSSPRRSRLQEQPRLPKLPAVSQPQGFAFAEISVDAHSERIAQDLLTQMGFAHAGNHKSKRVQLWEQGSARLLLNRSHSADTDWARGDTAISVIGVEDPNSSRSAARAQQLLAPPAPRALGLDEALLPAFTMPDGTDLFFCHTSEPTNWLADFDTVSPGSGQAGLDSIGSASIGSASIDRITSIDHVALSPAADHFEETLLAYQATFGLNLRPIEEFADPYGLLRSRALTSEDFNLIFNGPVVGGADSRQSGVQHIAFRCASIFQVAEYFRANDVPLLAIPLNYYDDLSSRTDLDPVTLDRLREYGILYDRSSAGEFYQLYPTSLSRKLFFEVVQRVEAYEGFGAPNAPVRRAMQSSRASNSVAERRPRRSDR
jgi:4-hydroxyphenylpyruvate dioxygenase